MKQFHIDQTLKDIKESIKLQREWRYAKAWAKVVYPNWIQFATQKKKPEIQETYRKKILNEYRNIF